MQSITRMIRQSPVLVITIIAALPMALLEQARPWGAMPIPMLARLGVNPSLGQWIVVALVLFTVCDAVIGIVKDIMQGRVGVDVLAVIALLATLAVQEYWAAWAVVLMVWSGDAIEEYAQNRAQSSLSALVSAAPVSAHRLQSDSDEAFTTVPIDAVRANDELIVLPGEIVPVDGELVSATATLDMSNINGEPLPQEVRAGERMLSGAVNGATALTMRALQEAKDSQYQRILQLVRQAQQSRAMTVRTADRLAVPFTILSLVIAGVAWVLSGDPMRFAQVLVLATPCPLLIAVPVAYMAGTGRLAQAGILIKSQEVLEHLGAATHIFFDKTGTLTVKQLQVIRVDMASEKLSADAVLALAGAVETYSVHILAKSIATAGKEALQRSAAGEQPRVLQVEESAGSGVQGVVDGHLVRVGRLAYVLNANDGDQEAHITSVSSTTSISSTSSMPSSTPTTVSMSPDAHAATVAASFAQPLAADEMAAYVSIDHELQARIVLRDVPREHVRETLQRLRSLGVRAFTMLTGDKLDSARIVAREVGIDDVRASLLPEGKVAAVREESERGRVTMMVGDGVNDAPVLAAATLGIAMTDGSTTAASESAQVVIMNDNILSVARAVAIAKLTRRIMLQAVVGGLALAIVAMLAAACNLIPVVVGAFAQEGIDVVSIMWALTIVFRSDDDAQA